MISAKEWKTESAEGSFRDNLRGMDWRREFDKPLDMLRTELRKRHYSIRTEQSYETWIGRLLTFHNIKDPGSLSSEDVKAYLEFLAKKRRVSSSTQNQALCAIGFFWKHVLHIELGAPGDFHYATISKRLPVVLTREEAGRLFDALNGCYELMAGLMYGAGLRLMECANLRVKDVDFTKQEILVRNREGQRHRTTILPSKYSEPLKERLKEVRSQFESDKDKGIVQAYIWPSVEAEHPEADKEWAWQYVFPALNYSIDPGTKRMRRHHINGKNFLKALKNAGESKEIKKDITSHVLRHSFAVHLLEEDYDIRTVQQLLGHANVATTRIYKNVLNRPTIDVESPVDRIP